MKTLTVLMKLPKIKSFEYTSEYRPPMKTDWFLNVEGVPKQALGDSYASSYPILRKVHTIYATLDKGLTKVYFESKALEDAMAIIESMSKNPRLEAGDCENYEALANLLKEAKQ